MRKFITSISLLAGLTLAAQNSEFQISACVSQSLNASPFINSLMVQFSQYGSNASDSLDSTWPVTNTSMAYPFSVDASSTMLRVRDSRPVLRQEYNIPFGVWNINSGDLHIRGIWNNASDSSLYTATLIENATGNTYNLNNECVLTYTGDTSFATNYTVRIVPKLLTISMQESCFNQGNGSIYAKSGALNWSVDMYKNSVFVNTYTIAGNDTLFTGLGQGTYDLIYSLDNHVVDTTSVIVSGPAQVVAAATISNLTPFEGDTVLFTNNSTGATTYSWDFGDSYTDAGTSPAHAYTTAGAYTVTLTAYNAAGCNNAVTYTVNVQPPAPAMSSQNNVHRTNMNGNSTARSSAVTMQSENGQAKLGSSNETTVSQFSVYSMNGQLLFTGTAGDNTFTYDAPGIYLIKILYSDGTTEAKKWYLN